MSMDNQVYKVTDKILEILQNSKGCKIAECSIVPDGDPFESIKSRVTIKFVCYDTEEQK